MPHFIRKRRGWDFFTPAEIKHLPIEEQKRVLEAVGEAMRCDGRLFRQAVWSLSIFAAIYPLLYVAELVALAQAASPEWELFSAGGIFLLLACPAIPIAAYAVRRHYFLRATLRRYLWDAVIRPAVCFECRYYVEGFEGDECPNCGAALIVPKVTAPTTETL